MISRKSDSIQRRFTLGSAMVITVILVTFSVLLISYNSRAIKKDLHAQLNKLISFSQTSLGSALWQYNYDYIRDYLDSLFLYEDLIYVSVTNKDIEIRKTNDSEFNDLSFAELRASAKFMVAETTVLFQNQEVGTVRIALSLERENRLLIVSSSLAIIMLLIMNVAVFGTNLLLSRRYFLRHCQNLRQQSG